MVFLTSVSRHSFWPESDIVSGFLPILCLVSLLPDHRAQYAEDLEDPSSLYTILPRSLPFAAARVFLFLPFTDIISLPVRSLFPGDSLPPFPLLFFSEIFRRRRISEFLRCLVVGLSPSPPRRFFLKRSRRTIFLSGFFPLGGERSAVLMRGFLSKVGFFFS